MVVFALTDSLNVGPLANLGPFVVGLLVAAIGMSFGANAGYAINPARDFGPRMLAWLAGWGKVAMPGIRGYLWIPIIGPIVGGIIGATAYDLFIRRVLEARSAAASAVAVEASLTANSPGEAETAGPGPEDEKVSATLR